jgi:putative redox protein
MSNGQLQATVSLINDKIKFEGIAGTNAPITIDYIPPIGDGEGIMPLELILMSLAACSGATVALMLRRMQKKVTGLKINASGVRREEHPLGFKSIELKFLVNSPDADDEAVQKAIKLSEETYCPVWTMLKASVEIKTEYKIL